MFIKQVIRQAIVEKLPEKMARKLLYIYSPRFPEGK